MFAVPLLIVGLFAVAFGGTATSKDQTFAVPVTKVVLVNLDAGDQAVDLDPSDSDPSTTAGDILTHLLASDELKKLVAVTTVVSADAARDAVDSRTAEVAVIIPADVHEGLPRRSAGRSRRNLPGPDAHARSRYRPSHHQPVRRRVHVRAHHAVDRDCESRREQGSRCRRTRRLRQSSDSSARRWPHRRSVGCDQRRSAACKTAEVSKPAGHDPRRQHGGHDGVLRLLHRDSRRREHPAGTGAGDPAAPVHHQDSTGRRHAGQDAGDPADHCRSRCWS